ncbi:bromodomain-containing protein [Aureococcus anophagefferens]|nr:bromodomain-containing protein [Aureococcus anophagefferens]
MRGCDKCRPDGAPAIAAPSARRVAAPAPAPSARRVARLAPVPSPSERRVAAPAPAPVHRLLASAPSAPSVGPSPGSKFWDEGQDWVVYRREGRRTWMPAPVQAYVELDVVYYYPAGAPEPTEESYLDECEYSAVDEVAEWIAKTPSRPAPPPPTPAFAAGLGPAPGTRFVDKGKLFVVFRREPRVVATDVMRNMASNALGSKEVLKERDVVYYYAAGARVIPDETSYLDVCDYKDVGSIRELIASTKVYTCEPCGRTFASANALNGHQANLVCRAALDRSKPKPKPAAKAAPVFVRAATFLDDDDEVGDRCSYGLIRRGLRRSPRCPGARLDPRFVKLARSSNRCCASSATTATPFFASPVDPVRDQAPNYAAVIENPMDLSTVAAKLELGAYDGSDDAFAADVHLIFDNAMLYNANPAHIVHEAARRLKNAFDECMNNGSETETPSFAVRNAQRLENLCNLLNIKRFDKPVRDVEKTRGDAKLRALQSRRREYEERRLAESAALEPPSAEKRPHPYDFDEPAESTPPPLHKKPRSAALGEEPAAPHGEKRPRDEDDPAEIDRDAKKQHGQSTPASVAHVGQVSAIPGSFWI